MKDLHTHLSHLFLFQSVVRLGSFQAVANKYGLPRSSISKKIQQLESKIGQPLILRSTRKLNLTEAGRDLLNTTASLSQLVENTQRLIEDHESSPTGKVKISCSSLMGQHFILPLLTELRETYPSITLELCLSDAYVDLIEQEIDIAIRIGHLPDSSLVARKIGEKCLAWYVSPKYIDKYSSPLTPSKLSEHNSLVFKNMNTHLDHWLFKQVNGDIQNIKVAGHISTDDGRALVEMACLGLGVIMIDPMLIQNEIKANKLVPILTDWIHPENQPIHLVCLGRKNRSRASTAIWEALAIHLQNALNQSSR